MTYLKDGYIRSLLLPQYDGGSVVHSACGGINEQKRVKKQVVLQPYREQDDCVFDGRV